MRGHLNSPEFRSSVLKKGERDEETFRKTRAETRGRSKEETFPEAEGLPVLHG
jgi:hypothetical protein